MKSYVLDSYVLLAYFRNEAGADEVERMLVSASENKCTLYLSTFNAGEVYYMSCRKDGEDMALKVWKAIQQFPIQLVQVDLDLIFKAAQLKSKNKLSYADAIAAALTIFLKSTLLTGDDEFKSLKSESGFKVKYID